MPSQSAFVASVKRGGTSTAMTGEAMSLVSGFTYQINDLVKRIWDRTVVPTFEGNTIPIAAGNIASIDYLFGTVTFTGSETTPITVATGNYIPVLDIAGANSFAINMSNEILDDTDFVKAAANGAFRTRLTGLRDVSVTLGRWSQLDDFFFNAVINRTIVIIDIRPGLTGDFARGWFIVETDDFSGAVDALEVEDLTFQLASNNEAAFSWGQ